VAQDDDIEAGAPARAQNRQHRGLARIDGAADEASRVDQHQ